jgi:hypothetical protein
MSGEDNIELAYALGRQALRDLPRPTALHRRRRLAVAAVAETLERIRQTGDHKRFAMIRNVLTHWTAGPRYTATGACLSWNRLSSIVLAPSKMCTYAIRNPMLESEILLSPVENGYVAYDPVFDRLHQLNPIAALVIELCDGSRSIESIRELTAPLMPEGTQY